MALTRQRQEKETRRVRVAKDTKAVKDREKEESRTKEAKEREKEAVRYQKNSGV